MGSGSNNIPSTSGFVSFLNFFTEDCSSHLELRVPLFEGDSEFCLQSTGTTCTGVLRGYTLPESEKTVTCTDVVWSSDDCDIASVTNGSRRSDFTFADCETSSSYPGCTFIFSQGLGLNQECNAFSTTSYTFSNSPNSPNSPTSNSSDDDDDSSSSSSRRSSSGAASLIPAL